MAIVFFLQQVWLELLHKLFRYFVRIIKQQLFLQKLCYLLGACSKIPSECCSGKSEDKAPPAIVSVWFSLFWSLWHKHPDLICICPDCAYNRWHMTSEPGQLFCRIIRLERIVFIYQLPLPFSPSWNIASPTMMNWSPRICFCTQTHPSSDSQL